MASMADRIFSRERVLSEVNSRAEDWQGRLWQALNGIGSFAGRGVVKSTLEQSRTNA